MCQRSKKGMKILLICLLWILPGNFSWGQSFQQADSWLFSFPEGENLLLADYGENARELQQMRECLRQARVALLEGTEHLLFVSHIASHLFTDPAAINEASLRASRLRAYIKVKLKLPHECIAFYVDRSGHNENQLHVYRVPSPVPTFANQEINYSESQYAKSIEAAVGRYGATPFVDMYKRTSGDGIERVVYRISDALFEREELDDYLLQTGRRVGGEPKPEAEAKPAAVAAPQTALPRHSAQPHTDSTPMQEPSRLSASGAERVRRPFFLAVKMNLLPWCALVPSVLLGTGEAKLQKGSFMPNAAVECYFADRWSVGLSGLYSDFAYQDKTRDRWSVSVLSVEPRVWPLQRGQFAWLNTGLFGEYGDYDIRGSEVDPDKQILYGRTGRLWSAGASVGCLVPLGVGFCVEASVRMGYRSVFDGRKYRYDKVDNQNYLESRFSSTGFMVGLHINMIYRFGIK